MNFKDAFDHVNAETKTLKDMLSECAVQSYAAPLPLLNQFEKRSSNVEDYLPEGHFTGKLGLDQALLNLGSYFAPSGTNTFHVRLCPGLIQVKSSHMLEVERQITLINRYKKLFSDSIAEIKDKRLKHEEIHAVFPMLMTKQVDRKINFTSADDSLLSISYSLASKTDQSVISYDDAQKLCLDKESSLKLSSHKGCELRVRKPKTKRFYANCLVDIPLSNKNKPIQLQGGIPIVGANRDDELIRIRHFVPNKKNMSSRSKAATYVSICPMHHIYAMVPNQK